MSNKTEWVVRLRNKDGYEIKVAYRTAQRMAEDLQGQTKEGWVAVKVFERPRKTYAIVQFDADKADYLGDEQDGCYYQVAECDGAYYCTVVVDCDTAGFVDNLYTDEGPFDTIEQAADFGHDAAYDWCAENGVPTE